MESRRAKARKTRAMQKAMPKMQVNMRTLLRKVLRMMYFWLKPRRRHRRGNRSSRTALVLLGGLGRMHWAGVSFSSERATSQALPMQHKAVRPRACPQAA